MCRFEIELPFQLKRKCRNENNLLEWKKCICEARDCNLVFTCEKERMELSLQQFCGIHLHSSSKTRFIILYREMNGRTRKAEFMASSISICGKVVDWMEKWRGRNCWQECGDNVQEEINIVKRVKNSLEKLEKENWELQCENVNLTKELTQQNEILRLENTNVKKLQKELRERDFKIEKWKLNAMKLQESEQEIRNCNAILNTENKLFREKELEFLEQQEIMCAHIRRLDALVYGKFSH
uniref:AlNc14C294G10279 protein n=1 Tax=Albugo laibachii Nc14 TaxID=890382 RepID=F0WVD5_9STRA|nr:AlNc14C294G10279 [Albugo laibachii Nc14]|eukprot:CCA25374.1 AlNc14C294G10279 [Albugo laibachii Nc14]